ncbi:MAG: methionine adenosyltransferase [Clostridiaceae bacterium]|nr:methionine adenosyltransferase [Clostridiaceae bacterium]
MKRLFTSESVTEGHPDKVCDQIADGVLDALLAQDPQSRVACEVAAATGMILVMGEISTNAYVDIPAIVRRTIRGIGYDNADYGLDYRTCAVLTAIDEQSPDIALGVDQALEYKTAGHDPADLLGAGDQGMMFGYACDDTPELFPAPIAYAHRLSRKLAEVRKSGALPYLRPDGKTQITFAYDDTGCPVYIDTVVLSTQHAPDVAMDKLRAEVLETVIHAGLPVNLLRPDTKYYINPTGRFVLGGPAADTGLTGRKIICDTYGGMARHGGGAFSGKDPTKVDRSAAYMARFTAKNVVAAGLAHRCEIGVAYAIGVAKPVSIYADTFGTGRLADTRIADIVAEAFDFRPAKILERFALRRPLYQQTAAYGHFGRTDIDLPWERLDDAFITQKF